MSPYVVGALIAAGGGVLVGILTLARDHLIRKADERERNKATLRRALADYLVALDTVTLEIGDEPPRPKPSAFDRAMDRMLSSLWLIPLLHLLSRLLRRVVYGQRHTELTDRLVRASSELRLLAPPEIEAQMQAVDELFQRWSAGDKKWEAEWRVLREQVRASFRIAVMT